MARAWHLMSRPQGLPTADNFALKEIDLPALEPGMARVRNRWLSVDPYMRGRMNDVKSYVPPFQLDAPMSGGAVGEVVESSDPGLAPGDIVLHMSGWRDENRDRALFEREDQGEAGPGMLNRSFSGTY